MAIIYTLLGVPYVAVLDPVRGIVLQKAARKRIPSPGQMSLFAGNEPKEGDTKVENGVTYRLNQNSRWERTDKTKGKGRTKPKAVVPVVEESTPEDLPQPTPEESGKEAMGEAGAKGAIGDGSQEGTITDPSIYAEKAGISLEDAQERLDSVRKWTTSLYSAIQSIQEGNWKDKVIQKHSDNIQAYINSVTPYKGQIYRKIEFWTKEQISKSLPVGKVIEPETMESWTSADKTEVAKMDYGTTFGRVTVILSVKNPKSAAPIQMLSNHKHEKEVLTNLGVKYIVKSVSDNPGGWVDVELEDITPTLTKSLRP